jgi:hypothetical protein
MIINWLWGLASVWRLASWLVQLWDRLDEKTKRQIIEAIVQAFEELLRSYYKEWKNRP